MAMAQDQQVRCNGTSVNFSCSLTQVYSDNKEKGGNRPYDVIPFMFVLLLSLSVNLRVFYIIIGLPRKRLRPVTILIAHLSSVAITFSFIVFLYVVEKKNIADINGPGICEILSFIRNAVYSVYPLNVVGIICERIRSFRMSLGKLLIFRTICFIWILGAVGSVPCSFMVKYEKDDATKLGKCRQIPLFGKFGLTIAYEVFRFVAYHVLPVGYKAYALYQIRSKISYLYILKPIPNEQMKRKVQRVRFVYVHSIIFMVLWLPVGFFMCLYKLGTRITIQQTSSFKYYFATLIYTNMGYFMMSPLICVCLNENISVLHFCIGNIFLRKSGESSVGGETDVDLTINKEGVNCVHECDKEASAQKSCTSPNNQTKRKSLKKHNGKRKSEMANSSRGAGSKMSNKRHGEAHDLPELSEMSRISTIGVTAISETSFVSSRKMCDHVTIISSNSDSDGTCMIMTAKRYCVDLEKPTFSFNAQLHEKPGSKEETLV